MVGLQKQDRQQAAVEMQKQAAKPFARSLEDVDEDLNLKGKIPTHTLLPSISFSLSASLSHSLHNKFFTCIASLKF